jgi:hypothetical protein
VIVQRTDNLDQQVYGIVAAFERESPAKTRAAQLLTIIVAALCVPHKINEAANQDMLSVAPLI